MALEIRKDMCDVFWCSSMEVKWYGVFEGLKLSSKHLLCNSHAEDNGKMFSNRSKGLLHQKEIDNPTGERGIK